MGKWLGFLFWVKACWNGNVRIWEHYHVLRMAVDSLLCRFKMIYPAGWINEELIKKKVSHF